MSEQVDRKKVDWEQAGCLGLDTEMFYKQQSELLAEGLSFLNLRRVCFQCPIWQDCLRVAFQYEQYGFWGGLSEEERKQMYRKSARRYSGLMRDLKFFPHIKIDEIRAIANSVTRNFGDLSAKSWRY